MGLQLIFVVETNKKSKSDWIYVKDTVDYFYKYERTEVKFSPIYMEGRGKYNSPKKQREIEQKISQYSVTSENNYSKVIYCFDCDKQDSKEDDRKFLEKAKKYCKEHKYEFVWFCKDVEDVYLGKQVDRSEKTKEAVRFKKNNLIKKVDSKNLVAQTYKAKTSNIMKVLDRYEELNRNV